MQLRIVSLLALVVALVGGCAEPLPAVKPRSRTTVPAALAGIDPTPDPACRGEWLIGAMGQVLDEAGRGIAGARPQLCLRTAGRDAALCLNPPATDANGEFVIEVPEAGRCANEAAMRVFVPGSGQPTTYCHLDVSTDASRILDLREPVVVYDAVAPRTLPPEGDANTSRTVAFEDGLELEVTPSQLRALSPSESYASLAARRVDLARETPCFAAGLGLTGLYGFVPEATVQGQFAVRIPNSSRLAAGRQVDLFVLGGLETSLTGGDRVKEAEFVRFGTGTVSSDGRFIESAQGSGLPYLSWLGFKAR